MGQVYTSTASGQGSLSLGTFIVPLEMAAKVITLADNVNVAGVSPVRRLHQQGWYGLGFTAPGGPISGTFLITWSRWIEVEAEDFFPFSERYPNADTLYWDLMPGAVMYFEVDW